MITSASFTLSNLKQLWLEIFVNKTDKVSDISNDSVLNGVAYGCSKVAQKAIKDIAITESKIFPVNSKGSYLDESAKLFGVSPRRAALGSATYVKVIGDIGTLYEAATHSFKNTNGINFEMIDDFTIGDLGYGYISVRSTGTGEKTNVDAATITTVTPVPAGHKEVANEYYATYGADAETDEVFRIRIQNNKNILSKSTVEFYNQLFQETDSRVLKTFNLGRDDSGNQVMSIVTQNGSSLAETELDTLLTDSQDKFSITEISKFGSTLGVKLENVIWYEVGGITGIDFRVELDPSFSVDDVRKQIQINLTKKLDFRFWETDDKVEWDDLFFAIKNTDGVRYLPDVYFMPNADENVPFGQLPRIKVFKMRDLEGNIIFDSNGVLSPTFYPSE